MLLIKIAHPASEHPACMNLYKLGQIYTWTPCRYLMMQLYLYKLSQTLHTYMYLNTLLVLHAPVPVL